MAPEEQQTVDALELVQSAVASIGNVHDRGIELLTEVVVVAETARRVNGFDRLDPPQVREAATALEKVLDSFWHRAF
jgi:hypothetical protein